MALDRGLAAVMAVALLLATSAAAADMSIISYNEEHGARGIERTEAEARAMYELWLAQHGRAYNALGEYDRRFRVFWDNLKFVDEHNARADEHGYRLGMNDFADLTNDEFRATYLGAKPVQSNRAAGRCTATMVSRPCRTPSTGGPRARLLPSRTRDNAVSDFPSFLKLMTDQFQFCFISCDSLLS
ncbi:hypothetical protein PR202_gb13989 [Eleusine coracana subsp. coracana]|uniref:Cathepsin propeptide inhibitor domain-containing protein n=1 Tax=Eleusine coracana subsp. coracana TaxID=191504 RepID=A0AAV5EVH1_ELECO|nr:hypothetical protein PR202_gb13989 [Eleusine coracana subsp. coracana]